MKKTIIAVATLAAASLAQATDTTWTSQSWTPASTGQTSWEGSSADKLIFNGTSSSNKNGDEWTNAQLFIQGTEGNSQKSTITGGTLEFISQNPATNDANNAPGVGYNAVVLGGNSSLTIDVGTLLLGDSVIDQTDKKGGDRGIRLSGSNNTLTIYADRIVSYTGDEFIHVRQGNGSSVANIGSADRRIGYFEAHTGWGKDDYGVALLQANEGNKVFLYADEAVLDGSTNSQGGVIGSGGWGELRDLNGNIGAWARVFGSEQKYGDAGQVNKNTTIQVGADVKVADAWTIGGAFSYTDGSVEATGISGDNKAYAFTAYGVWQHENGSYLDLTARYARLDADFTAQTMTGSYNNNAYAVTAEVGHKFNLSELAFIEPQAEVIYGRVVGDDFTASNGTRFSQKDYDSLIGRLGARAGFNFPENKGNIYARFSVVHDFQGEVETTALNNTSRTVKDDLGGTWVEYGVGGNFRLSDTANVYVDLERTSGGEIQENWRWTIGARKVF